MNTANKSFLAKRGQLAKQWFVVDATDQVLGRLAIKIAAVLMGKHKPTYTPHVDTGDYVIVLNCGKFRVTGSKLDDIEFQHYTGYPGGRKVLTMRQQLAKHPEEVLYHTVRRMMPKTKMGRQMLSKLKLCQGATHNHQAQMPEPFPN